MRTSCLECVLKHLAQAEILFEESLQGYELHRVLAWGHMAEASAECLERYPALANKIRDHRKLNVVDEDYKVPSLKLIEQTWDLLAKEPEAKEPEAKEPEAKEPEAKEPEANTSSLCTCAHSYKDHWEGKGCILCQCLGFHASNIEATRKRADEFRKAAEDARQAVEKTPNDLPF